MGYLIQMIGLEYMLMGVYVPPTKYSYTGSYVDNEIVFNFNTGSLPVSGSYPMI